MYKKKGTKLIGHFEETSLPEECYSKVSANLVYPIRVHGQKQNLTKERCTQSLDFVQNCRVPSNRAAQTLPPLVVLTHAKPPKSLRQGSPGPWQLSVLLFLVQSSSTGKYRKLESRKLRSKREPRYSFSAARNAQVEEAERKKSTIGRKSRFIWWEGY